MASLAPDDSAESSTPLDQLLYHVRLIDPWQSNPSQPTEYSFFGLQLELHGLQTTSNGQTSVTCALNFTPAARNAQLDRLESISGPFQVIVASKMTLEAASELQKPLLQALVPVQTHNLLARINKIHFIKHCHNGADVFHQLVRVYDSVSVAKPFELTFLRHNHTQAAAKIRPFAARSDVQAAQVAQFQKIQAEEAQWPQDRKTRKQFVLQQMDFHREAYLYHHIGRELLSLHDEIMAGGGHWHAYEFERALWYYHTPTDALYAEHPMRNNHKTRQLIGSVQLRTRMAAQKLQHGTKHFLRCNRLAVLAIERMLDAISGEILMFVSDLGLSQWLEEQQEDVKTVINQVEEPLIAVSEIVEPGAAGSKVVEPGAAVDEGEEPVVAVDEVVEPEETELSAASAEVCVASEPVASTTPSSSPRISLGPLDPEPPDHSAIPGPAASQIDEDSDDDDDDTNWRSRLRLLKEHYQARHPSPTKAKTNNIRTTSLSALEPILLDRSSFLLDVAIDGPMQDLVASLKEPTIPWHRDGSFRSFHAFFTSSTPRESLDTTNRSSTTNFYNPDRLPVVDSRVKSPRQLKMPHVSTIRPPPPTLLTSEPWHKPTKTVDKPITNSLSSPLKKLPYIRRRK